MQSQLDYRDTPSLLIDVEKMERTLKEMATVAADAGVALRPHVKTHKCTALALRQLELGARGITVAKIGEAEVMAHAGIRDIRIAYPVVGEYKLKRLAKLMERAEVSVSLDSVEVARGLSDLGRRLGRRIPILLKINAGLNRTGVLPEDAVTAARALESLPGVQLVGILTHEGQALKEPSRDGAKQVALRVGAIMVETAQRLRQAGFGIEEVSVGSTPTVRDIARVPGVTEIRPGTYIFNDFNEVTLGVASEETCALTVLATIISIPADDRAVLDAGAKTLSSDLLSPPSARKGYGYIKGYPDITIARLNEEHGILTLQNAKSTLKIGQQVEIIPNHVCPVVNLADVMYLMRNGVCEGQLEILAAGKNR
ncbi:MAG: alanine racemase [Dehalococcoidia bacterium]|jgi:D-serine deaminase-like pyridoxal phosphate-dependent protein|nr:alanine racemase [Dehalococcoidia bacterium]